MTTPALTLTDSGYDISLIDGELTMESSVISDIKIALFSDTSYWHNNLVEFDEDKIGLGFNEAYTNPLTNASIATMERKAILALNFIKSKYNIKTIAVTIQVLAVDRVNVIVALDSQEVIL